MDVRLTLFDEGKEPLSVTFNHRGPVPTPFQRQISITVGDKAAHANVAIPLVVLTSLMAKLMEADQVRNSPIVMPDKKLVGFDKN